MTDDLHVFTALDVTGSFHGSIARLTVPGGWIYYRTFDDVVSSVFVPGLTRETLTTDALAQIHASAPKDLPTYATARPRSAFGVHEHVEAFLVENGIVEQGTSSRALTADLVDVVRQRDDNAGEVMGMLGNLLAVIHGDGGHYLTEHGLAKACKDAEAIAVRNAVAYVQHRPEHMLLVTFKDRRQDDVVTLHATSESARKRVQAIRDEIAKEEARADRKAPEWRRNLVGKGTTIGLLEIFESPDIESRIFVSRVAVKP